MGKANDSSRPFEIGPIRPPNEAQSLLLRVTRNCPYNRCSFCPVYKGSKFSLRKVDEIQADIAAMVTLAERFWQRATEQGGMSTAVLNSVLRELACGEAVQIAEFIAAGGRTAFLQDANSLIMPAEQLCDVLRTLRKSFPTLRRVTTYARAHTVSKRSVEQLVQLREAGLDRIHIGLESGADEVLKLVAKGVSAERHIEAGKRVKQAGLDLSEYVMPGLGGKALSSQHAVETARVLREIDPHFIRFRSLTIPPGSPLAELCRQGLFEPQGDVDTVRELRIMLAGLEGVTSTVRSDHILNLLEEISGQLPEQLPQMLETMDRFLELDEHLRDTFVVGRRLGMMRRLADLDDSLRRQQAELALAQLRAQYSGPLDAVIRELMTRFV